MLTDLLKSMDRAVFGRLYDQHARLLQRELAGSCDTLLDLGCGSDSPIAALPRRLGHTVGVDAFGPSIERSRARGIHDEYHRMGVLEAGGRFGPRSFDCVMASDVIEHLSRADGLALLDMMERLARVKVVVYTPNGFLPQRPFDGNGFQEHLSGWEPAEMRARGYRVTGVHGWKPLRGERWEVTWKPRPLWSRVSAVSQLWTTARPEWAFQLLCVKDVAREAPSPA
jgi:SAM-dependent methyltransferase